MQLKRFALFRDDVRDLVTLTVDRALHALTGGLGRIQWPGIIVHDVNACKRHYSHFSHYSLVWLPKDLQPFLCETSSMRSQSVDQYSLTKYYTGDMEKQAAQEWMCTI